MFACQGDGWLKNSDLRIMNAKTVIDLNRALIFVDCNELGHSV